MTTAIRAKKDMYNAGKCFTEGKVYTVSGDVTSTRGLFDKQTTNDLNEPHIIGSWWRNFEILKSHKNGNKN